MNDSDRIRYYIDSGGHNPSGITYMHNLENPIGLSWFFYSRNWSKEFNATQINGLLARIVKKVFNIEYKLLN